VVQVVEFDDEWSSAAEWAAMYRGLGLQVVPSHLPVEGGQWKRPVVDWLEFQHSLTPDSLFARWYGPAGEHRARKNMGLITGAASGGLLVVDLDNYKNPLADQWWIGLLRVHSNSMSPDTWAQFTGGGGFQFLFRCPPGYSPPTFKAPSMGIDVRGQGGFIVCPPSMHSSGKAYEWIAGQEPWACDLAEAPEWLIEAIEILREEHGGQPTGPREHVASTEAKNAFGLDVDDREHKLQVAVWGAMVDLYRESPLPPSQDVQERELDRLWANYERTTKSRLTGSGSNAELLEREGRGRSELVRKWRYALKRWDTKVRAAATERQRPEAMAETTASAFGGTQDEAKDEAESDQPPPLIQASTWKGEPPEREWIVRDWVVCGAVNSLYGDGGLGKTLLAQQLAYAVSKGARWLGMETMAGSVMGVFCEDDEAELHRRHNAIKASMGHPIGNPFDDVWLWPRAGHENVLVTFDRNGVPTLGKFHAELSEKIGQLNPALLIVDTLADVFGGNEMDRPQVNYFAKTVLGGFIRQQKARGHVLTVLLLGHPSVSGMSEGGRGYSGSTAWNNAVRSRIYLSRPEKEDGDARLLTRGKANYASSGDETGMRLGFNAGVFIAEHDMADHDPIRLAIAHRVRRAVDEAWAERAPFTQIRGHRRNVYQRLGRLLAQDGYRYDQVRLVVRQLIEDEKLISARRHGMSGLANVD